MAAFKMPRRQHTHCKNDAEFASELICENGIISAYTIKYFEAS